MMRASGGSLCPTGGLVERSDDNTSELEVTAYEDGAAAAPHMRETFADAPTPAVELSIVVPVFNERANLPVLHERIRKVVQRLGRTWEICYVDDGSTDDSLAWLRSHALQDPGVRVVELERNFGQHAAVLAGFAHTRGQVVVTLDADLQNPPEEIPRLLAMTDRGFDAVGGWREHRRDPWSRTIASRVVNGVVRVATGVPIHDYGCMLRAYRRSVVQDILARGGRFCFIPVAANAVARRVAEISVAHAPRLHGESKYSLQDLLRLLLRVVASLSAFPTPRSKRLGAAALAAGVGLGGMAAWAASDMARLTGLASGAMCLAAGIVLLRSSVFPAGSRCFRHGPRAQAAFRVRRLHEASQR
ncbi:MAG: hypothetical protein KatS3mg077_3391 [Candidatus Binatia bacterium]|nr:MAG: hypothetical protein KatS3mg077_3391 [Candidatus Binatia bacterium]